MSVTLVKELCWVAASYAMENSAQPNTDNRPDSFVKLASEDGKPVRCFSGNEISIDISVDQITSVDALFIGAFWGPANNLLAESEKILKLLVKLHQKNIPLIAVSNGSFLLAEAGLLNGRIATLYPPAVPAFVRRYPDIDVRPERAITDAGNLYCANGIASGCDLTVSIIKRLFGAEIARRISHEFLLGFSRDYTIANVSFDGQKYHKDKQILTAQSWLENNYTIDVQIACLASDLGMSPRNFSRRFKQATGDNPGLYLKRVRIAAAKELLRESVLSVAEIVYRVGYNDISYFCRIFKAQEGCMPNSYRQDFPD